MTHAPRIKLRGGAGSWAALFLLALLLSAVIASGQARTAITQSAETNKPAVAAKSTAEPEHCPSTPSALQLPPPGTGQHKVVLSWNASTSHPAWYCVYRSETETVAPKDLLHSKEWVLINSAPVAATACMDDLVRDDVVQHYVYVVTAINAAGSSLPSNLAQAKIPNIKESTNPVSVGHPSLCRKRGSTK